MAIMVVSQHIHILYLNWWDANWTLITCYLKPELPHLTLFQSLQELQTGHVDGNNPPHNFLTLIFTLFAGSLRLLQYPGYTST